MSAADIDIRPATEADIPVLVRARRLMFEELDDYDSCLLDQVDAEFDRHLRTTMPAGTTGGWVAVGRSSGEWVGALTTERIEAPPTPNVRQAARVQVFGLFVRSEYRRTGIARTLVNRVVEEARAAGAGAVQLHASDFGRPLYESLGFKATTEMRLVLSGDNTGGC